MMMYTNWFPQFTALFPILLFSITISYWIESIWIASQAAETSTGCEPKSCGNVTNISYPFWLTGEHQPYCGYPAFELTCENDIPALAKSRRSLLHIHDIFYGNRSFLAISRLAYSFCPILDYDVSFDELPDQFRISDANRELFFLHSCPAPPPNYSRRIHCAPNDTFAYLGGSYGNSSPPAAASSRGCKVVAAPAVLRDGEGEESRDYIGLLSNGFVVEWRDVADCRECRASGGACGYSEMMSEFVCMCGGGRRYPTGCSNHTSGSDGYNDVEKGNSSKLAAVGLVAGAVGFLLLCGVLFLYARKRFGNSTNFWNKSKSTQNIEAMLENCGSLALKDIGNVILSMKTRAR